MANPQQWLFVTAKSVTMNWMHLLPKRRTERLSERPLQRFNQRASPSQPVKVATNTLETCRKPLLDTHLKRLLLNERHFERMPRKIYGLVRRQNRL